VSPTRREYSLCNSAGIGRMVLLSLIRVVEFPRKGYFLRVQTGSACSSDSSPARFAFMIAWAVGGTELLADLRDCASRSGLDSPMKSVLASAVTSRLVLAGSEGYVAG